jgi:hypothetical protein
LVPVSPEASRELAEYPVRNPPVLIPSFDIESVLAHGNLLLSQSQFEVFDEAISWALLFGDRQVRKEAMPPTPVTLADGPSPDVAAAQGPVVEITPLGTARDLVFIEEQPEPPISIVGRPSGRTVPVTIRVKPFGARVTSTANASLSCPSPCTMYLAPGDHSFFVASEGYEDKTVAVVARRDGRNHDFNLELRYGAIRIDGEGIANARVFVDGRPTATALPAELSLPVGRYAVTLRAASGLEQVKHVVLSDRIFSHVVF